jgi:ferric-dicitrate binding protein FerR (iron transport regulator)
MESKEHESLFQQLIRQEYIQTMLQDSYPDTELGWKDMVRRNPELRRSRVKRMSWQRIIVVAALLVLVLGVLYIYWQQRSKITPELAKGTPEFKSDVPPGTDKALLTLGNGSTIELDSAHTGELGMQGHTRIVKTDSGQVVYMAGDGGAATTYNTLTTPRGGQFQLVLPDGTKVWLNAASSLRFPTVFSGGKRRVELTGEAYFEVVKNSSMPFSVEVGNSSVEVLGTHFEVMAYPDENGVSAALLEGSIRFTKGTNSEIIQPGEQATAPLASSEISVRKDVDLDAIVAWKNGMTVFKNARLQTIMRTVARWYDVQVIYQGSIPEKSLSGGIPRNTNLSQVLKVLESYHLHFKLEGKQITVMP